jgi:hypothetical protein
MMSKLSIVSPSPNEETSTRRKEDLATYLGSPDYCSTDSGVATVNRKVGNLTTEIVAFKAAQSLRYYPPFHAMTTALFGVAPDFGEELVTFHSHDSVTALL